MNAFLEAEYNRRDHAAWRTGSGDDLGDVFAVAAGTKPAGHIDITGEVERGYAPYELADFLKQKGAKVVFYTIPTRRTEVGDDDIARPALGINHYIFAYRNDESLEQYRTAMQSYARGTISLEEYNRQEGRVLGYSEADIAAFAAIPPQPTEHEWERLPLTEYLKAHAPTAVYEELMEDPFLGPVLPPARPGPRISKG